MTFIWDQMISPFLRNQAKKKKKLGNGRRFVGITSKLANVGNSQTFTLVYKDLIDSYIKISWAKLTLGALN